MTSRRSRKNGYIYFYIPSPPQSVQAANARTTAECMSVSPLPRPPTSRSRLRAHRCSPFPRGASTIPPPDRPPRRFQKSRRQHAHHEPLREAWLTWSAHRADHVSAGVCILPHFERVARLTHVTERGAVDLLGHDERRRPSAAASTCRDSAEALRANTHEKCKAGAPCAHSRNERAKARLFESKQTRIGESIKDAAIVSVNRRRLKPNSDEMEDFGG